MPLRTKTRMPVIQGVDKLFRNESGFEAQESADERQAPRKKGKLDRQTKLLLLVNALFVAANALSGTFVNVYLWKAKNDLSLIAWFALMNHMAGAGTVWLSGKWVKQHNKMNCLRLGVGVSALFYTIVLLLGAQASSHVILLGIVQGMAAGFFWLAFNVVYFEVTEPDNRDLFNGWAGLLGSGAGMIAPWLSGLLIVSMKNSTGYRLIFALSLIVFVVGAVFSFFLKKREAQGSYDWFYFYRCLRENRNHWLRVGAALASQGLREGVFAFIIGLLVYISTRNEMKLGNYALITSAVSLISFMFAGRLLKPRYRKSAMLAGAVVMVAVILVFFWKVSFATLLTFGIAISLFYPLYSIPMTSRVFDLIGESEESARNRVEYVVMREFALDAGRILGVVFFLVVISFNSSAMTLNWIMLIVGCSPLAAWGFMKKLFG